MPPTTQPLLRAILRGLVLRLIVLMGAALAVRVAILRARLAGVPEGARERLALEMEIARLERVIDFIGDPEVLADPRYLGMIAEAARCGADAGRRAWIRWRWIYGWATRFFRLPRRRPAPAAVLEAPEERCRCALV